MPHNLHKGHIMKTQIFSIVIFGSMRYARAENAQQARRIFARSINADRKESDRPIRISLDQIRYVGQIVPAQLGAIGYDAECKRMPQRFRDETEGESYMNADNLRDAESDKAVKNAESIVAAYFA